jgi:hypothetical protein
MCKPNAEGPNCCSPTRTLMLVLSPNISPWHDSPNTGSAKRRSPLPCYHSLAREHFKKELNSLISRNKLRLKLVTLPPMAWFIANAFHTTMHSSRTLTDAGSRVGSPERMCVHSTIVTLCVRGRCFSRWRVNYGCAATRWVVLATKNVEAGSMWACMQTRRVVLVLYIRAFVNSKPATD